MPFEIRQQGGKYCVVTQGSGERHGCHTTRSAAKRQLKALYANVPEARYKATAPKYSARADEQIAGNLYRGGDGKFTSGGNANKKPTAAETIASNRATNRRTAQGGKPRKGRSNSAVRREADKKAREAEREAKKRQQAAERDQKKLQAQQDRDAKKKLSEIERNRKKRLQERERDAKKRQAEAEREKKRQERGGGGGGKSGGRRGETEDTPITPAITSAIQRFVDTGEISDEEANKLVRMGLAHRNPNGTIKLLAAGLNALKKKKKEFSVFKDAKGRYRWVMVSSTAFRDRDGEIVSIKALEDDVAASDLTGIYGPLRWWHVPGLDIGDCDYRCVVGKSLLESGTFRDDRIAEKIAQSAGQLQASIGFIHGAQDPDNDNVYHTIRTFERSLVPLGRAANPFTRLVVKEKVMLTTEKEQVLRATVGNAQADELLAAIRTTEKSAEEAGVAYKQAPPPPPTLAWVNGAWQTWSGTQWQTISVKATTEPEPPEPEEEPVIEEEEKAEPPLDEGAEEAPVDDTVYVGDMTPEAFTNLLAAAFQQAIAPMMEAVNVEAKMRGALDEMKSMVGTYTAKKDDEQAKLTEVQVKQSELVLDLEQRIQGLETTLKEAREQLAELRGEQPKGAPYIGSQARDNVLFREKETHPVQETVDSFFDDYTGRNGRPTVAD